MKQEQLALERANAFALKRRSRFVEYVAWSLHHNSDHMTWEDWKQAWNAGVIR